MCWARPRIDALRRRLAPAGLLGHGIEHREMLGVLAISLRRNASGSWPAALRQLVDEALEIDGVLVVVHAAPEPRRDVRVAHRVIDQQVRDGVAERAFRAARVEALERDRIPAVLPGRAGAMAARIDWPEMRMCRPVRLLSASSAAGQLALRDRVIDGRASCPLRATRSA